MLISTQGAEGRAFYKSTLLAKLSAGQSFEMQGFGGSGFGSVEIKVKAINLAASPAYASVTIGMEQESAFVNCGGGDYDDGTNVWRADTPYVDGGSIYSTTAPIGRIYQTERWGADLVYNIPLPSARYDVFLHFAEIYLGDNDVGGRVFRVKMEDSLVFPEIDIVRDAGKAFKAHVRSVTNFPVTDGSLKIELVPVEQFPKVTEEWASEAGSRQPC